MKTEFTFQNYHNKQGKEDTNEKPTDLLRPQIKTCQMTSSNEKENTISYPTLLHKIQNVIQIDQNKQITHFLISAIIQLGQSIQNIQREVKNLERKMNQNELDKSQQENKRKRRKINELQRKHICLQNGCFKTYASDVSLNLHKRLKHQVNNQTISPKCQNERKISVSNDQPTISDSQQNCQSNKKVNTYPIIPIFIAPNLF